MMVGFFVLKLVLWAAVAYGISQIITESLLFERFRNWVAKASPRLGSLVSCMLCTGVWVSFVLSIWLWSPSKTVFVYDIVNVDQMVALEYQMQYDRVMGNDTFATLLVVVTYFIKNIFAKILFVFFDGMLGSTLIWFMYVFERRLVTKK